MRWGEIAFNLVGTLAVVTYVLAFPLPPRQGRLAPLPDKVILTAAAGWRSSILVSNVGTAPLVFRAEALGPGLETRTRVSLLEPGESSRIAVSCNPKSASGTGKVLITSSDPVLPQVNVTVQGPRPPGKSP